MTRHTGSCQCGAVAYEIELDNLDGAARCNCSRCRRTGVVWCCAPRDAFRMTAGEGKTGIHRFNTGTIDHHFCTTCGIQPFALGTTPDGRQMAAANLRCVDGVDIETLPSHLNDGAAS